MSHTAHRCDARGVKKEFISIVADSKLDSKMENKKFFAAVQYFSDFRGLTDPALWKSSTDVSERSVEANVKHSTVNLGTSDQRGISVTTCNTPWGMSAHAEQSRDQASLTLEDYKTVFHQTSGRTGLQLYLTEPLPPKYMAMRHLGSLEAEECCSCCAGKAWAHLVKHSAKNPTAYVTEDPPEAWADEKMQFIFGGSANGVPVPTSWKPSSSASHGGFCARGYGGSSLAGTHLGKSGFGFGAGAPKSARKTGGATFVNRV